MCDIINVINMNSFVKTTIKTRKFILQQCLYYLDVRGKDILKVGKQTEDCDTAIIKQLLKLFELKLLEL